MPFTCFNKRKPQWNGFSRECIWCQCFLSATQDFLLLSMTLKADSTLIVMFLFPWIIQNWLDHSLPGLQSILSTNPSNKETSRLQPPAAKDLLGSAPNWTMGYDRLAAFNKWRVMKTERFGGKQTGDEQFWGRTYRISHLSNFSPIKTA